MHKRIQWIAALILALASPALFALGLGSAKVNSYLNQPLDVRVELISRNSEELQSVTAKLASAKDFELLGLILNAISVPLQFEVISDGNMSYIHITSDLKVSNPVMQVLVEVVWANGRMLREYTLFLDPPTLGSKAPAPQVSKPAAVAPAAVAPALPAVVQPASQQIPTRQAPPKQVPSEPAVPTAAAVSDTPSQPADEVAADTTQQTRPSDASERVGKGQTLWGIASDWSKGTGYGVNQAMIAIQRNNPQAFINDNINLLKQGEILRMPASNEMAEISSQQAALEVQRQASDFSPALSVPDYATPTVADSGDYQETYQDDVSADAEDFSEGRLEIVPPSESDNDAVGAISQASDEVTAANVGGQVLQEKLTRAEEDLINAELENSYLKDRIAALEDEAEAAKSVQVEDANLAGMETAMADKQASDEPVPPVAITPGGEQQPWYAGATIWLIAAVLFLILLVVWFLRRRNRIDSESLQEIESKAAVQAVTDDAEDLLDILDTYGSSASTGKGTVNDDEETAELGAQEEADEAQEPDTVIAPVLVTVPDREEPEAEDVDFPRPPVINLPDETASELDDFDESEVDESEVDKREVDEIGIDKIDVGDEITFDIASDDDDVESDTVIAESEEVNDPELKLDLARAYLSLGDKEAARSMLDEVLLNGNQDQIAEAKQMLDEL